MQHITYTATKQRYTRTPKGKERTTWLAGRKNLTIKPGMVGKKTENWPETIKATAESRGKVTIY